MKNLLIALAALASFSTLAAENEYQLVIKDHQFQPTSITIPAGEKVKLVIDNQDATPEEFESHSLHREKIIPGNSKATINIGPLKAGEYSFVGEFHEATAKGTLIAE